MDKISEFIKLVQTLTIIRNKENLRVLPDLLPMEPLEEAEVHQEEEEPEVEEEEEEVEEVEEEVEEVEVEVVSMNDELKFDLFR